MRNMNHRNRTHGVTLIELMIVVVIIGILASIAYPSYRNYMQQSRRSDAQTILLKAAARQEKFYSECRTYTAATGGDVNACSGLGVGSNSDEGYYTIAVTAGTINAATCNNIGCGYTITATPVPGNVQDGDGALRIDSVGVRQWNRKNSGWVSWTSK